MQDVLTLLKEYRKQGGYEYRVYQSDLGTLDQISIDFEFEDMMAREKWWAGFKDAPETSAFFEKWYEMTKSDGTNEIWKLVE